MSFWDSLGLGDVADSVSSAVGDSGFWGDLWGAAKGALGSGGFWTGLSGIGSSLAGMQSKDAEIASSEKMNEANNARALEIAKMQAEAAMGAASIAAASAEKRQKLAAIMDASGRRIDANFTGTGQKLSALQQMMSALKRR